MQVSADVSLLLSKVREGDLNAFDQVIPMVYGDLRRLAAAQLRTHAAQHTLQPTALVHEAFLRLLGMAQIGWQDRAHFFASAARIMRHLLIDRARARNRMKRAGGEYTKELTDLPDLVTGNPEEVLLLSDALQRLEELDPRLGSVVEMRCFLGLGLAEIAVALGVSERTAKRDWSVAKAWLNQALRVPKD